MPDFVKYLIQHKLVKTSLVQFNIHLETFRAWRSAFVGAIQGSDLTASKDLDLLTNLLGK